MHPLSEPFGDRHHDLDAEEAALLNLDAHLKGVLQGTGEQGDVLRVVADVSWIFFARELTCTGT